MSRRITTCCWVKADGQLCGAPVKYREYNTEWYYQLRRCPPWIQLKPEESNAP